MIKLYNRLLKIEIHSPGIVSICLAIASLFIFQSIVLAKSESSAVQKVISSVTMISSSVASSTSPIDIHTATHTPTPTTIAQNFKVQISSTTPTPTSTSTLVSTATSTETASPTPTDSNSAVTLDPSTIFAPIIVRNWSIPPIEIEDYLICDSLPSSLAIPDNSTQGVQDKIYIDNDKLITDVEVYLNIDHTWIGDLEINLGHDQTGINAMLVDRPGLPSSNNGCSLDNLRTILDDQASQPAEAKCLSYPAAIAGIYQPTDSLDIFNGLPVEGNWSINIIDHSAADSGQLNKWCLHFSLSNRLPDPKPSPTPLDLPESARISGISGEDQALPLDCESRSAVDWANYFGKYINEFEFLDGLPISDHPDIGFVGDVNGIWGQIPPNDYGVHADPIANLLREYDLSAQARVSTTWDEIRNEIAESRPVIVWVVGSVVNGAPNYYTSQSNPDTTIVARYEHTVMVIGYTEDSVIILDGDDIYTRSLNLFLESWSALNNMAVLMGSP